MKYKVGDKVRIVSDPSKLEGNETGIYSKYAGQVMTISNVRSRYYYMAETGQLCWYEPEIEGLTQEPELIKLSRYKAGDRLTVIMPGDKYHGYSRVCTHILPDGTHILDFDGVPLHYTASNLIYNRMLNGGLHTLEIVSIIKSEDTFMDIVNKVLNQ